MKTKYIVVNMIDGSSIIGIEVNNDYHSQAITLNNPQLIQCVDNESVGKMVILTDYMVLSSTSKIDIERSSITCTYTPSDTFINLYNVMVEHNALQSKEFDTTVGNVIKVIEGYLKEYKDQLNAPASESKKKSKVVTLAPSPSKLIH